MYGIVIYYFSIKLQQEKESRIHCELQVKSLYIFDVQLYSDKLLRVVQKWLVVRTLPLKADGTKSRRAMYQFHKNSKHWFWDFGIRGHYSLSKTDKELA